MKRLFITLSIFLLINSYNANSQTGYSVDKWMEYIQDLALDTEDEERINALYADLSYLAEHPFDINTLTVDNLKRLPFLSDRQIEQLVSYRERYGKMVSIYELKNVAEMDIQTLSLLLPFVYIGDITVEKRKFTVKNLLKYGSNELQIRYDQCFQQKKGYCSQPDSIQQAYPNRVYKGEPFYHSIRYSYAFDDRLQIGFVAEKDAAEPFWNKYHKGYDYYSFHLLLKDINWLKSLAVGDYKVSFGQGLVISNDFSPSGSTVVTQAERRTNGFRRHFSTNEHDFFRGIAATIAIKSVDLSLFYSYRKMDAAVDSLTFASLKTDGIHRLERDWEKRHTVSMQTFGGNIRYATPDFHVGFTALSHSFGKLRLEPDPKPYNLFYFRGSDNMNMSVDYMLKTNRIKFYGETALSQNGAFATLNGLQLMPASYISFLLLHRYYDKRYQALFGNAFSKNSSVQNEQGIYMGLRFSPFARWKLSGYVDIFRFPWLKYGVDTPSTGQEYMVQADYTPNRHISLYVRYKSLSAPSYGRQRFRLQCVYGFSESLVLKSSVDGVFYGKELKTEDSKGFIIAQSMAWKPMTLPVQSDLYVAWFSTDDYDSRVSSYEKNMLYAFNMPSFYGKGIRLAISFRWDLSRDLSLSTKLGHTSYTDRKVIGTDLEEIAGSNKTDLYALLRWKF